MTGPRAGEVHLHEDTLRRTGHVPLMPFAVRLGELHHAIESGLVEADAIFSELGAIIAGSAKGRPSQEAITIADLTGTGVQDTAIATLARDRARQSSAGTNFES